MAIARQLELAARAETVAAIRRLRGEGRSWRVIASLLGFDRLSDGGVADHALLAFDYAAGLLVASAATGGAAEGLEVAGEEAGEAAAEETTEEATEGAAADAPKNLGRGSTGRTEPRNLTEQLAMKEAQSNPTAGRVLRNIIMKDSHWPTGEGWVKMQQNINGVVIHYVYNPALNAVDDYKFAE